MFNLVRTKKANVWLMGNIDMCPTHPDGTLAVMYLKNYLSEETYVNRHGFVSHQDEFASQLHLVAPVNTHFIVLSNCIKMHANPNKLCGLHQHFSAKYICQITESCELRLSIKKFKFFATGNKLELPLF